MNARRFLLAGFIAAMAIVASVLSSARTGAEEPRATEANPLAGKYLMIKMDRALDEHAAYLNEAQLKKIGDETFVVGKGFALGGKWKWYEGRTIWLSAHHIEQMFVFDSVEEMNKMYEKDD